MVSTFARGHTSVASISGASPSRSHPRLVRPNSSPLFRYAYGLAEMARYRPAHFATDG